MPIRDGPADGAPVAGRALFVLAGNAASIWRQEIEDEIALVEEFMRSEMVRVLTEQHGLDRRDVSAFAEEQCRRLRAAIAEARKARREVIAEQGSVSPDAPK